MWEQEVAFWIIAVAMAGAAIGVVRSNNVVHAALFLVVVLAGAAGLYILLVSEFVAWVQVLIYIGAVIVLFLFGIMLTRAPMREDSGGNLNNDQRWASGVVALFTLGVLTALLIDAIGGKDIRFGDELVAQGSTNNVADSIFRDYVLPFEVISMLLLGALIGAIVLARRD
jgi:NADH-quinone oxidoreductase subunit J